MYRAVCTACRHTSSAQVRLRQSPYQKALDAEELIRLPGPDGKLMQASIRINGSSVMLVEENPDFGMCGPKSLHGTPVIIHLIVSDVDKVIAQAEALARPSSCRRLICFGATGTVLSRTHSVTAGLSQRRSAA